MSDLVGNPEDRFSRVTAHLVASVEENVNGGPSGSVALWYSARMVRPKKNNVVIPISLQEKIGSVGR